MEKKKWIKVCVIVLGIFFGLACVESFIRFVATKTNEYSKEKEIQKQEEKSYYSDNAIVERQVKDFMTNVMNAYLEGDFEYIHHVLDEDYRNYMFHNKVEELKAYMQENILKNKDFEIIRINKNGGMYQVLVGTNSGDSYSSQGYTVKVVGNQCSLMLEEYIRFEKTDFVANYQQIQYKITYRYKTPTVIGYVLDITNLSSEEMKIDFTNPVKLQSLNGEQKIGNKPESCTIATNQVERKELIFYEKGMENSYIELETSENGTKKEVIISLIQDIM